MANRITNFKCSLCSFTSTFNEHAAGSRAYQELWQSIQLSEENYVTVICPTCTSPLIQCLHCTHNIHRYNHPPAIREKRKPQSYMARHIKGQHKDLLSALLESAVPEIATNRSLDESLAVDTVPPSFGADDVADMFMGDNNDDGNGNYLGTYHDDDNSCQASHFMANRNACSHQGISGKQCNDHPIAIEKFNDTWGNPQINTCVYSANYELGDLDGSDASELEEDRDIFGSDAIDAIFEHERETQTIELNESTEFLEQFDYVDLDPESGHNHDGNNSKPRAYPQDGMFARGEGEYAYNDFDFFDVRRDNEKNVRKGNTSQRYCQNQLYFYQKYKQKIQNPEDDTGGFAGECHRANVQDKEDSSTITDHDEAHQMFRLLNVLINSTGKMKEEVIGLQAGFFKLYGVGQMNATVKTRYPTDMKETRSTVTEGTHSIMKNFPVPTVFDINNHACVSLVEVIRLMAGHGATFNFAYDGNGNRNREGLNGTKATDDLLEEVEEAMKAANVDEETRKRTKVGWILMWSDGFLRCFVKQGDNAVWIITVTVCPPEHKSSSGMYTHTLAMGKGTEDHTEVIEYYLDEINRLREGFQCYFGATNSIERFAIAMIVWNADRPERQMIQHTRKEGIYGKVSGWAVNVSEEKLPSCLACYKRLIEKMKGSSEDEGNNVESCPRCCNWSFDALNSDVGINDSVGKDYPQSSVQNANGVSEPESSNQIANQDWEPEGRESGRKKLGGVKLTNEFMLKAGRHAYTNMQKGHWKKANLLEFGKVCNIKGSKVEFIGIKAQEDRVNDIFDPSSIDHKAWSLVDCFERFKFPDVPLHGLGHGMIPDVMYIVQQIFSHHNKYTSFVRYGNTILEDISSFRLDYCKIKKLPKAAWVGENCMAYMRLMSYLVGSYLMNNSLSIDEEETKETVANLRCMLNAFQALVSVLMTKREVSSVIIDNHMKLFMSSAHYLHMRYGKMNRRTRQSEGSPDAVKGNKRKRGKTKDFISSMKMTQLESILREFDKDDDGGVKELKKRLREVSVVIAREKLQSWGMNFAGSKDVLMKRILDHIIPPEDDSSESDGDGDNENGSQEPMAKRAKREKRCWNKGNWVSFLANISRQIVYLGVLALIW